jgi:hypothetical protein
MYCGYNLIRVGSYYLPYNGFSPSTNTPSSLTQLRRRLPCRNRARAIQQAHRWRRASRAEQPFRMQ